MLPDLLLPRELGKLASLTRLVLHGNQLTGSILLSSLANLQHLSLRENYFTGVSVPAPAEAVLKDIRRQTRRHFSAEDKIRIVLDGLRGEDSIAELCRKEGIAQSLYYTWSKEFMEAGKRRLAGDTARAATTDEVKDLRREARDLKECVADLTLENRLLKKSMIADGGDDE